MNNYLLAHASNGGEALSESLNFTAPTMAGYARRRSHRALPPLGGSEYGLQGSSRTTTMRFRISGDEFLDPSTLCLKFRVTNTNAGNQLIMVAPAYCFFRRMRVLINGYQVEEIDDYNRTCALVDACSDRNAVYAARVKQGFWNDQVGCNKVAGTVNDSTRTFVVPFRASGLFNNWGNKFLPMKYLPQVDIELETASLDDVALCLEPSALAGAGATTDNKLTAANIIIDDVRVMYDTVMLDSSIEDEFYKHLEAGNTLDIPFSTWRNTRQQMTPNNFSLQVAANVKSARSLFFSVIKKNNSDATAGSTEELWYSPAASGGNNALGIVPGKGPTSAAAGIFYRHAINNFEVQVGNQTMPDSPITSLAEFYHYLQVAWNKHNSYSDPLGISYQEYRSDRTGDYTQTLGNVQSEDWGLNELGPYPVATTLIKTDGTAATATANENILNVYKAVKNLNSKFIVGLNLERLLDLAYSGVDLANEVISIRGTCKDEVATASIMLHYNAILRIGRGTCDVLERG